MAHSSVGRTLALQARGPRFESECANMSKTDTIKLVAQDAKKWASKKVNGSDRKYRG